MNPLVRNALIMVAVLFAMAQVFTHHAASTQASAVGAAASPSGQMADTSEPYNPWGKAQVSPVTHRAIEPKVLTRDETGQFHVNAAVNGREIRFLVDTGADLVALTPQAAQDLGLNIRPEDYKPVLRTASGPGMGAPVWLDSVELVGRQLDHQRAVVAQGVPENLLGQSVLRRLGRVELKGDTMVLAPN
ncbi:MAG: TIGR02281 family clan AA aspartic protease [Sphingomonadales bacterium]|nr:TIGR02281 family clan AA aspartic protease [Sphingomonadales bacterium]MDE2168756.1 TIGR02281 family clan AA aspartic protease [Sphingomonadales bacterium]